MKISKLFHWLYAFLMFLPITFILPTLLYFGFNDNAAAQEYTKEEPIYYQTNTVNDLNDLVVGNIYHFYGDNINFTNQEFIYCTEFVLNGSYSSGNATAYLDLPYINCNTNYVNILYDDNGVTKRYTYQNNVDFDFVYNGYYANSTSFVDYLSASDYLLVKEYHEVTYTMGITESVNQSILDTFDLPMFSWTSDNFIIAPFNYITDLFGLPNGNVINKYLDYWLSISIIYLCFDVIMYVPLLVHRWLDKGIVE